MNKSNGDENQDHYSPHSPKYVPDSPEYVPESPEYVPDSPDNMPSIPSPSSPSTYSAVNNTPSDNTKTLCSNIIQSEPGGILLSSLFQLINQNNSIHKNILQDLLQLPGIDIVCYPTQPSNKHTVWLVSSFLRTFRNREAPVYTVRKQFPRITNVMWQRMTERAPMFRICYYDDKQHIRLISERREHNNKRKRHWDHTGTLKRK